MSDLLVGEGVIDLISWRFLLQTLNSELSHKLEVQTQRLELAVAQSMAANDGTPRLGSTYAVSRVAPEYIDEEDEVITPTHATICDGLDGSMLRRLIKELV